MLALPSAIVYVQVVLIARIYGFRQLLQKGALSFIDLTHPDDASRLTLSTLVLFPADMTL